MRKHRWGQKVNKEKTSLICSKKLDTTVRSELAATLGYVCTVKTQRNLGVADTWGRSRNQTLGWLRKEYGGSCKNGRKSC